MASVPSLPWLGRLLSLEEWAELDLPGSVDAELVEGVVVVVPKPSPLHQRAMVRLATALDLQLPEDLTAVPDVDVVLRAGRPASVREPDVVVVPSHLVRADPPRLDASDVLLAVEIVSPGTGRTDRVTKMSEYAEAGIAGYWILEPGEQPRLTVYRLAGGAYREVTSGAGVVHADAPVPLEVDVPRLFHR